MLNVALLPLFANMIGVIAGAWGGGRTYSFQLTAFFLALIVVLLRWKLYIGIALDAVATLVAVTMLFWSPEPFAYLVYTGALLAICVFLSGLIWALTRRGKEHARPEG